MAKIYDLRFYQEIQQILDECNLHYKIIDIADRVTAACDCLGLYPDGPEAQAAEEYQRYELQCLVNGRDRLRVGEWFETVYRKRLQKRGTYVAS